MRTSILSRLEPSHDHESYSFKYAFRHLLDIIYAKNKPIMGDMVWLNLCVGRYMYTIKFLKENKKLSILCHEIDIYKFWKLNDWK